jgi:cobalt/nickel transport system permease protein
MMLSHVHHPIHHTPSYLTRVDPRARILSAVVLTVVIALLRNPQALLVANGVALVMVAMARISPRALAGRLLPLELLLVVVAALCLLSSYDRPSELVAGMIFLKANAAALALVALVATMDAVTLGHALAHLYVPQRLTQLLMFMVRYCDVLAREYFRLRKAMRVRCFRPRMDGHSYRTFGHLVGMLLVRSFDRSHRVLAAMKCRGFRGQYWMLDHFHFVFRRDAPFCAAMLLTTLLLLELGWR